MYFEHAEEYGPLLNLKVARKKTSAGPVPMVITPNLNSTSIYKIDYPPGWLPHLPARSFPEVAGARLESPCGDQRGICESAI